VKKIAIIIVAAGQGRRAGEGLPKQYRLIAGKAMLRRTIEGVISALPDALVQVVIGADDHADYNAAMEGIHILPTVFGGASRQLSVYNGLQAIECHSPEFVLIHDAARPFLTTELVSNVTAALESGANAVIPAIPIVDTLNKVQGTRIAGLVDRSSLFAIQTPQGFDFAALMAAHKAAKGGTFTDDGSIMEAAGHPVEICAGDERNFKVTHPHDFKKAEAQIMNELGDIRTGTGYDVHRFEEGEYLWLCGVKIPFTKALKGHSDADVGLHALTDALLSAVAAGDIGTHFPPTEEKWRGAASDMFIKKAAMIIRDRGGVISNVAVCLICEKPKIGPQNEAMTARIAALLGIAPERVSVQATTTEKLGFTGREEGIAAQATATVRLPWQAI